MIRPRYRGTCQGCNKQVPVRVSHNTYRHRGINTDGPCPGSGKWAYNVFEVPHTNRALTPTIRRLVAAEIRAMAFDFNADSKVWRDVADFIERKNEWEGFVP